MRVENQTKEAITQIASLTLTPCEIELRAFELFDLQGYVELLDNRPPAVGIGIAASVDAPTGLSPLSEPAGSLQLLVDAS